MSIDKVRDFLKTRGIEFSEKELQYGVQFRCADGEIIAAYSSGKVVPGGKRTDLSAELVKSVTSSSSRPIAVPAPAPVAHPAADVFVVYGHDLEARKDLELLLHRMGVNPIVLGNLAAAGDTIIEKLEAYVGKQGKAAFACVLLTPDDEGHKSGATDQKRYRARQNVVLELGMVLAKLGRKHVAILTKESVEAPSDIAGLIYIAFKERVDEVQMKLMQELKAAGLNPRL